MVNWAVETGADRALVPCWSEVGSRLREVWSEVRGLVMGRGSEKLANSRNLGGRHAEALRYGFGDSSVV